MSRYEECAAKTCDVTDTYTSKKSEEVVLSPPLRYTEDIWARIGTPVTRARHKQNLKALNEAIEKAKNKTLPSAKQRAAEIVQSMYSTLCPGEILCACDPGEPVIEFVGPNLTKVQPGDKDARWVTTAVSRVGVTYRITVPGQCRYPGGHYIGVPSEPPPELREPSDPPPPPEAGSETPGGEERSPRVPGGSDDQRRLLLTQGTYSRFQQASRIRAWPADAPVTQGTYTRFPKASDVRAWPI